MKVGPYKLPPAVILSRKDNVIVTVSFHSAGVPVMREALERV